MGIDLRHAPRAGIKTIVQCKHYLRTGFEGLLRDLKAEAEKVTRLKPCRYVLVTSVPLSPQDKEKIINVIGADVLTTEDVIGAEQLNNLLSLHKDVEGNHYKLWLASRAVLDRVLNNATLTVSEFHVQKVHNDIRRYVQNNSFPTALQILHNERVVIVTGAPGVGKTTLANMLLYEHLEKGYQAVVIEKDLRDAKDLFRVGQPQIFYFDDFMGATFLGDRVAFSAGEDRVILNFIAMVKASPESRFILTTREHILSHALAQSERMRQADLDENRVILKIDDYSEKQRAEILYNHVYFSELPHEYQDQILQDKFYLAIIRHKKFNPRLIEWLSTFRRVKKIEPDRYREFITNLLNDPSEIWRHAYHKEITDAARTFLLMLFSLAGKAPTTYAEQAFVRLNTVRGIRYGYPRAPEDFRSAFHELAGSFVTPGEHHIEVLDPSVLDLMNSVVRETPENFVDLLIGCINFDQFFNLCRFLKNSAQFSLATAVATQSGSIYEAIKACMLVPRKIQLGANVVGFRGLTFECRLATVISFTDATRNEKFITLIALLFERLNEEWKHQDVNITDGLSILNSLQSAKWLQIDQFNEISTAVRSELIACAKNCSSNDLRNILEIENMDEEELEHLRSAVEQYLVHQFKVELSECKTSSDVHALIDDLETIQHRTGFAMETQLWDANQAMDEMNEREEAYADHMQDEWKERRWDQRHSDESLDKMFSSLKRDR